MKKTLNDINWPNGSRFISLEVVLEDDAQTQYVNKKPRDIQFVPEPHQCLVIYAVGPYTIPRDLATILNLLYVIDIFFITSFVLAVRPQNTEHNALGLRLSCTNISMWKLAHYATMATK